LKIFKFDEGGGGDGVTLRDLKLGTGSRCLLRGPRPDGQRVGGNPRQPGGRRDRCRPSRSWCRRRCRSLSPDAHDDEGGRLKEGDHAENGRTDGRSDVKLLKIITGNNYYRYSM
jgi:hypothetical protein